MRSISTNDPPHNASPAAPVRREASSLCHGVLHILDHSHPLLSGYSVRSHSLIRAQKKIVFVSEALTGPLHELEDPGAIDTTIDEVCYRRTPLKSGVARY